MRGRVGTGTSGGYRPLKPKNWTRSELKQVKNLLKRGNSNRTIADKLKTKTPRDIADLLSREGVF
jgi:hypothetical protein